MPPKRHHSFRFSQAAEQALTTYSEKWTCSPTEALERLLLRWRYLDDVGFSEFQETLDDEIKCTLRIRNKGLFYCLHGVPNTVKLERRLIETLDICRVCRRRKLGLTEKSMTQPIRIPGREVEEVQVRRESFEKPSTPDPVTKPQPVQGLEKFSCPRYHNRSYCLATPCDLRLQCRQVGRIPDA
jgi:hypothetical protein